MLEMILESLDGLPDSIKAEYKEKDGKFHLDVNGLEDTGALKRAKEHEKEARIKAENDLKAQKESNTTLQTEIDDMRRGAIKKDDVEALEKSWKEKLEKRETELTSELEAANTSLTGVLVDKEALRIASELAVEGSANVLLPHIKNRLAVDTKDGKKTTVVMDAEGKPSALTLDELKAEFAGNSVFAPVIAGSKASGGGAGGGSGGGASDLKGKDLASASPDDLAAHLKSKKGE